MEGRRKFLDIEKESLTRQQIEEKYNVAATEWEDFKVESKKEREQNLLDYYPIDISEDTEISRKRRKKAITTIKKAKFRQHTFDLLTKQVGRGNKYSLKRVKVVNSNNEVVRECNDRASIEEEISNYNKKHFRKAYLSKAFKDKIYTKLQIEQIRDKILNGALKSEECDNEDVYQFMKLLKKPGGHVRGSNKMEELSVAEWSKVMKKSKHKSLSSVFSKRTYSVYKCALDSDKMTNILVRFYNTVLRKGYYLKR